MVATIGAVKLASANRRGGGLRAAGVADRFSRAVGGLTVRRLGSRWRGRRQRLSRRHDRPSSGGRHAHCGQPAGQTSRAFAAGQDGATARTTTPDAGGARVRAGDGRLSQCRPDSRITCRLGGSRPAAAGRTCRRIWAATHARRGDMAQRVAQISSGGAGRSRPAKERADGAVPSTTLQSEHRLRCKPNRGLEWRHRRLADDDARRDRLLR